MKKLKSFTLIELLLVIAIIGVLAMMITGNFLNSLKKGRDAKRKSDLENIQKSLEMYYEDNKAYPTQAAGSGFVFDGEFSGSGVTYMKKVPQDPKSGKNYEYNYDSTNKGYKLYACLENDQQVLPYNAALVPDPALTCSTDCYAKDGTTKIKCIYGVTSPNLEP